MIVLLSKHSTCQASIQKTWRIWTACSIIVWLSKHSTCQASTHKTWRTWAVCSLAVPPSRHSMFQTSTHITWRTWAVCSLVVQLSKHSTCQASIQKMWRTWKGCSMAVLLSKHSTCQISTQKMWRICTICLVTVLLSKPYMQATCLWQWLWWLVRLCSSAAPVLWALCPTTRTRLARKWLNTQLATSHIKRLAKLPSRMSCMMKPALRWHSSMTLTNLQERMPWMRILFTQNGLKTMVLEITQTSSGRLSSMLHLLRRAQRIVAYGLLHVTIWQQ